MRAIDVDDIETSLDRTLRGFDIKVLEMLDIIQIGFVAVGQVFEFRSLRSRAVGDGARFHARRMRAAVPKFDATERAMLMQAIVHVTQVDNVALVPDTCGNAMAVIGFR